MTSSLYDYTDKSVRNAAMAAIAYGVIALAGALLQWLQFFLYHRPSSNDLFDHGWLSQQWLEHTPAQTALAVFGGVMIATASGILAFGIFRRSKTAITFMLLLVAGLQLYSWFILHSISGSVVSIIVAAFLTRGAAPIFERRNGGDISGKPRSNVHRR